MRVFLLTVLTMLAFASNSILTRLAVEGGHADAISFAVVRVLAGAAMLVFLVAAKKQTLPWRGRNRVLGAASLLVYMIGFSLAYISLDAGLGALILFGVVQITMFSYAAVASKHPTARQLFGAGIAFIGLVIALWPSGGAQGDIAGAALMVLAGFGWAAYTISGKSENNPLAATGANFALCLPVLAVLAIPFYEFMSVYGLMLAILCGAVTSGLGYALWYLVLSDIPQNIAAVVQLSVPIIAIAGGALLLGETITLDIVVAAAFVVFGIALAVTTQFPLVGRK